MAESIAPMGHGVSFGLLVPTDEHAAIRYHVVDCKCGWQSPLCQSEKRALALYDEHKASGRKPAKRARLRAA